MYDLLLKNAWVVDPLNSVNGIADVAIQDGKIAKVQREKSSTSPAKPFSPVLLTAMSTSVKCGALPLARECWQ